jgi:O-acetyl-ADP-ribose deacetylase
MRGEALNIEIIQGDIITQETDAIVNAANNHLWMGAGVAGAIKRSGGDEIETDAVRLGPIKIGEAVATSAGQLKARYVIHAAGMGQDLVTSAKIVRKTTTAALQNADRLRLKSISFPAIGTGVGGLGLDECAEQMIKAVQEYEPVSLELIRFVLFDTTAFQVFNSVLERLR